MSSLEGRQAGGLSQQQQLPIALTSPLSPTSPLYTQLQSLTEQHFHIQQRLLFPSSSSSSTPPPSVVDLSRLDLKLQSLIISLSRHAQLHPSPDPTQQRLMIQLASHRQQMTINRCLSVTSRRESSERKKGLTVKPSVPSKLSAVEMKNAIGWWDIPRPDLLEVAEMPPPSFPQHSPVLSHSPPPTLSNTALPSVASSSSLFPPPSASTRSPSPSVTSLGRPLPPSNPSPPPPISFRSVRPPPSGDEEVQEVSQSTSSKGRAREEEELKEGGGKRRKEDVDDEEGAGFGRWHQKDSSIRSRRYCNDDDKENRGGNRGVREERCNPFISGTEKLAIENAKKGGVLNKPQQGMSGARPSGLAVKKKGFNAPRPLGAEADGPIPPMVQAALSGPSSSNQWGETDPIIASKLAAMDPKLVDIIMREVMDPGKVVWDDIAGLDWVKDTVQEIIVWPMIQPKHFKGLTAPPKGMLLFGPPGTGKTMIGKAMASEVGAKFFSISSSSLTSKWFGEGEKLVRTLFEVARLYPPAIIFIDELDGLLSARTEGEFEGSRRIKNQLLIQMDGVTSNNEDRVLLLGATNMPQQLDDAAIRRLSQRLYVPLPNLRARQQLLRRVLSSHNAEHEEAEDHLLTEDEINEVAGLTRGFSGADLQNLAREAAMMPLRAVMQATQGRVGEGKLVPAIEYSHFIKALSKVKPSVQENDLKHHIVWNKQYGSFQYEETTD